MLITLLIGFVLGCCALAVLALLYARTVARLLLALSDGWKALGESWRTFDRKPKLVAPDNSLSEVQKDVASALQNLGVSEKRALRAVRFAGDGEAFDSLFRKAQAAA